MKTLSVSLAMLGVLAGAPVQAGEPPATLLATESMQERWPRSDDLPVQDPLIESALIVLQEIAERVLDTHHLSPRATPGAGLDGLRVRVSHDGARLQLRYRF